MLTSISKIKPKVIISKNRLEFTAIEPLIGDYIFVGIIILLAIPLSWYTTRHTYYFIASMLLYGGLAYSLIDDKFQTTIDKDKNTIEVRKTKLGQVKWVRVSNASELVNAEVVSVVDGKGKPTYRLELEFMSDFGYHRLTTSDTTVKGEMNKEELEKLAVNIRDFMKLKPIPEWMKEENLKKTMPASMKKQERDALRQKK
ncbi:hypothetical protein BC833DRAFT_622923 [Globomyces pollinis-pini]|nr:hypothetical protein BC833DRAFT_622923 [Globomyces pollinis-pini]